MMTGACPLVAVRAILDPWSGFLSVVPEWADALGVSMSEMARIVNGSPRMWDLLRPTRRIAKLNPETRELEWTP